MRCSRALASPRARAQILFGDYAVAYGTIFAQCLPVQFWTLRLDVVPSAYTFVAQLAFRYTTYDFEDDCTARSRRFEREPGANTNANSPAKVLHSTGGAAR